MDTLRRVSETTTSPVSDSDSGRLNRRNTDISTTTTLSPASTSRSSAGSAESSHSLTFIKHESLKSAVEGGDLEMVSSFINVSGKHVSQKAFIATVHLGKRPVSAQGSWLLQPFND